MKKLIFFALIGFLLLFSIVNAHQWNSSYDKFKNTTLVNDSGVHNPIRVEFNATELIEESSLPVHFCIRIIDEFGDIEFGLQDNGNTTLDIDENISVVPNLTSGGTTNISVAYSNNTEVDCMNLSFWVGYDENVEDGNISDWNNESTAGQVGLELDAKEVDYGYGDYVIVLNDSNAGDWAIGNSGSHFTTLSGDVGFVSYFIYPHQTNAPSQEPIQESVSNDSATQLGLNMEGSSFLTDPKISYDLAGGWVVLLEPYTANYWWLYELELDFANSRFIFCASNETHSWERTCSGNQSFVDAGVTDVHRWRSNIAPNQGSWTGAISVDNFYWNYNESRKINLDITYGSEEDYVTTTTIPTISDLDYCRLLWMEENVVFSANDNWCVDNETLGRNVTFQITEDANQSTIISYSTEVCQYGCDNVTNECIPNPYSWNLNFLLIFGCFAFGLLFLIILKKKR